MVQVCCSFLFLSLFPGEVVEDTQLIAVQIGDRKLAQMPGLFSGHARKRRINAAQFGREDGSVRAESYLCRTI